MVEGDVEVGDGGGWILETLLYYKYRPVATLGRTGGSTAVRVASKSLALGWTFSPERGLCTLHITLGDATLEVSGELLTPSITATSSRSILAQISERGEGEVRLLVPGSSEDREDCSNNLRTSCCISCNSPLFAQQRRLPDTPLGSLRNSLGFLQISRTKNNDHHFHYHYHYHYHSDYD